MKAPHWRSPNGSRTARRVIPLAIVAVAATALGVATASPFAAKPHRGPATYGETAGSFNGVKDTLVYSDGYYCDTTVPSHTGSGCEVGAPSKKAPSPQHDPLYIAVPLGFSGGTTSECPPTIPCVDHPATIDLSLLEPALKPLYPTLTAAELTKALYSAKTPEHIHLITDTNSHKPEWWDVHVIGVTSPTVYKSIAAHHSYAYVKSLLAAKDPNVVGPLPSNLWLYFAA